MNRLLFLIPLIAACGGPPAIQPMQDMGENPTVAYEIDAKIDRQWPNRMEGQIGDCVATPKPPANFPIFTAERIRFLAFPSLGKAIIVKDGCKPSLSFQLPPGTYDLIHTAIIGRVIEEGGKVTPCTFSATNQGGVLEMGKPVKDNLVFVGGCGPGYVSAEDLK